MIKRNKNDCMVLFLLTSEIYICIMINSQILIKIDENLKLNFIPYPYPYPFRFPFRFPFPSFPSLSLISLFLFPVF